MNTETLETLIREQPFFSGLSSEHSALLVGCAKIVRFDAGAMIFRQGDPASYFYVIRHGHVAIELPSAHGGAITIQTLSEGDVLGWSWLMEPYRYRFDARAVMLTRVLSFDGVCLRKKCEEDATLGYHLFKRFSGAIAQRLEATRLQLLDLYGAPEGVRG